MKKLVLLALAVVLCVAMIACGEQKTEETVSTEGTQAATQPAEETVETAIETTEATDALENGSETVAATPTEEIETVGGWSDAEDGTVTDEHKAMFEKALTDYTGASFTPVKLVATQVVAGTNYKFLCDETVIVPDAEATQKYVTVYCDLEGNCSITNVEDVTE